MKPPAYVVEGTELPNGAPACWWVAGGMLHDNPVADAEPLPGRYVLPGLVDAHCHLTLLPGERGPLPAPPEHVGALLADLAGTGVLAVRDTGAHDDTAIRLSTGPRGDVVVTACGRFLAPPGGYFPGVFDGVEPGAAAAAAVAQVAAGARWVKVVADFPAGGDLQHHPTPNYDPATLRGLVEAVHQAGARVAAHVTTPYVAEVVAAGVDSIEHGTGLTADLLALMAERGAAWTPTLGAVTRAVPLGAPAEWSAHREARIALMRELLPEARRLGVPVLAGSDVVGTVAQEVGLLAGLGLEPEDALAASTTTARTFFDLPALAAGAPADLVTYDHDPRADPAVLAAPAAVVARGRRIR